MLERLDPNPEYWEGKRGAAVEKETQIRSDLSRSKPSSAQHGQESWLQTASASAALLGSRLDPVLQTVVPFLVNKGKYHSNFNPGLAQRDCEPCVTVTGDSSDPLVGIYR